MDQAIKRPKAEAPAGIEAALGLDSTSGRRPSRRRAFFFAIAVLVAAAAAAAYMFTGSSGEQIVYSTTPAERGSMTIETSATGTLQPLTQVEVSSELSGVVRAVPVAENQQIAKGDILAELDTTRSIAQIERAQASVQAAEAKVTDTQVTLKESEQALARARQLSQRGMVADQALDTATATRDRAASALQTAEANLAVARADLKLEEADLAKSKIYSPIDGIILTRDVDPGQTVASSLQAPVLFVIAEDLARMEVVAAVDEADIGAIQKGQDAVFTVDAFPGRTFEAEISDISFASTTTEGVVTYQARLAVDNADLSLRPGMTATVSIITRHAEDVLLVPNDAFRYSPPAAQPENSFGVRNILTGGFSRPRRQRSGNGAQSKASEGLRTLYVLRQGEPVAVQVKPGASDGRRTEILSGIEDGDAVITSSGPRSAGRR